MANAFTSRFASHVCPGDAITAQVDDMTVTARIEYDTDSRPVDYDCYSPAKVRQWNNDEWFFCGVALQVAHTETGIDLTNAYASSLWSIEANYNKRANRYLTAVANELLYEAIAIARSVRVKLAA